MSVHSTSPIMAEGDVQVIPMEEQQQRRQSWAQERGGAGKIQGPFRSGYQISGENEGTYFTQILHIA